MIKICKFLILFIPIEVFTQTSIEKSAKDFIPAGYNIYETVFGDLNKDGLEDCVLIIKGTDKNQIIQDEFRGELDRNRRGIIVLFNKEDHYEPVLTNYNCFSSENEDGGIYFPPELYVNVNKGNLYIDYYYGRYGYWTYTFRYQNSDFELIGYDITSGGVVKNYISSINFSTKKKFEKINTNEEAVGGDEVFKKVWKNISIDKLLRLSEIKDFDELEIPYTDL
ncbi:hypothetical protein ETU09_07330 [Apibacter muscae]|uniref:Uncharacterized protein n=1 Tax=Apibacter muscae TaxID=2509004 RepID=A0A563DB57_9FLAO|nr:hypothetical protein [Apibacter muscae]TWP27455.1 hypothetical protein ETU09_07330 [Apibacter muscae]